MSDENTQKEMVVLSEETKEKKTPEQIEILEKLFDFQVDEDWLLAHFVIKNMVQVAQKPLEELDEEEKLLITRHLRQNPLFAMFFCGVHGCDMHWMPSEESKAP